MDILYLLIRIFVKLGIIVQLVERKNNVDFNGYYFISHYRFLSIDFYIIGNHSSINIDSFLLIMNILYFYFSKKY